jgi:hypothetical protein
MLLSFCVVMKYIPHKKLRLYGYHSVWCYLTHNLLFTCTIWIKICIVKFLVTSMYENEIAHSSIMADNLVYVNMAFFTQSDTCNHIPNFGTPYANILSIHVTSSLFDMLTNVGHCPSSHFGHTPRTLNGSFPRSLSEILQDLHDSFVVTLWIPLEHHIIVQYLH